MSFPNPIPANIADILHNNNDVTVGCVGGRGESTTLEMHS